MLNSKQDLPFKLEQSWDSELKNELNQPYMKELLTFLKNEREEGREIFPQEEDVFSAFSQTPFEKTSVVIMGQDPYHGPGQAHGMSFSVREGVRPPPSLKNIFKELQSDLNIPLPEHGYLIEWAKQGVLLLNAILTVQKGQPKSHHRKGWERFTDAVIAKLATKTEPIIFVLWGKSAQEKCLNVSELKQNGHHFIMTAAHPSPYSANRGFFGCSHFSKINSLLTQMGKRPIDWAIH